MSSILEGLLKILRICIYRSCHRSLAWDTRPPLCWESPLGPTPQTNCLFLLRGHQWAIWGVLSLLGVVGNRPCPPTPRTPASASGFVLGPPEKTGFQTSAPGSRLDHLGLGGISLIVYGALSSFWDQEAQRGGFSVWTAAGWTKYGEHSSGTAPLSSTGAWACWSWRCLP